MKPSGDGQAFDAPRLRRLLPAGCDLAREFQVLASCESTSDWMREQGRENNEVPGFLVLAEEQTGGRGRSQRDWWSGPPCSNLSFTLAIPSPDPALAAGLAAACAVAAASARFSGGISALKWPNDILLSQPDESWAKVAGILAESPASTPDTLLLGIGVNVSAAPPDCARIGAKLAREVVLADILLGLARRLRQLQHAGPSALEAECLILLRRWAPFGIRVPREPDLPSGPLLEFSLSEGLTWGEASRSGRRPLGLLRELLPLPNP